MEPGIIALMIPLSAIVLGIGSGIVKMMTSHQQKMAEITRMNAQVDPRLLDELRALRMEVTDLRDRVNQQSIAYDQISQLDRGNLQQTPRPAVPDTLNQTSGL